MIIQTISKFINIMRYILWREFILENDEGTVKTLTVAHKSFHLFKKKRKTWFKKKKNEGSSVV